jgi:hypothetical protein
MPHRPNKDDEVKDSPKVILGRKTRKLFLVFERATRGDILKFLSEQLLGAEFVDGWDQVASALNSIACGIDSLHKHNVLHR